MSLIFNPNFVKPWLNGLRSATPIPIEQATFLSHELANTMIELNYSASSSAKSNKENSILSSEYYT